MAAGGAAGAAPVESASASAGTAGFHLSLDLDYVDPTDAPGVGTPVRGGATYREAHLAMEMINDSGGLVSMEAVEVNPVLDEANRTGIFLSRSWSGQIAAIVARACPSERKVFGACAP